jgi:hypothetical protein
MSLHSPSLSRATFSLSRSRCECVIFTVHLLLFEQGPREQEEEKSQREYKKKLNSFVSYTQKKKMLRKSR